jgi:hypothetical protein
VSPKVKTVYRCTDCGAEYSKWQGRCDVCGEWNTLVEEISAPKTPTGGAARRLGGTRSLAEGGSVAPTARLRDVHGTVWHVPNGEIKRIGNKSQEWSRAVLDFAIAHGTDISRAEEVMKSVADELWHDENWSPVILAEPEVLGVEGIGTTGITLRLSVRTRPGDQLQLLRQLRAGITQAFLREGIPMPSVLPTPADQSDALPGLGPTPPTG